jgi:hypothetical protein
MKKAMKIFLMTVFLLAGNTSNAQGFKHLKRGVDHATGKNYSTSTADKLGNLYILICDSTMKPGSGMTSLTATYHIEIWNGTLWIKTASIRIYNKKRYSGDLVSSPFLKHMIVYKGLVYVSGTFDSTDNNLGRGIIAWDGSKWAGVGNGLFMSKNWIPNNLQRPSSIKTIFEYKSRLVITGNFDSVPGFMVNGLAQLDSLGQWEYFGGTKNNTPFHLHGPDPTGFYQVVAPEIVVALDSVYFYQTRYYTPDKLGYNGSFDWVMNGNQSKSWIFNNKMGVTLWASDGKAYNPVNVPNNFVVRRVFEYNGELGLMGHFDSSFYFSLIARRVAGKWQFTKLPDDDSLSFFPDSGLISGHYTDKNNYVFMGKLKSGPKPPVFTMLKTYFYDGNNVIGKNLLRTDSTDNAFKVLDAGKKKYLSGTFLHLRHWNSAVADSSFNYASEILNIKTMVLKGKAFIDWNLDEIWQPYEPVLKHKMVYLKDSAYVASTDDKGDFILYLPAGSNREIKINMNRYYLPAWSDSKIYSSAEDTLIYVNFPMDFTPERDLKTELVAYCGSKARRGSVSKYSIKVTNVSGKPVKPVDVKLHLAKKTTEFKSIGLSATYDSLTHSASWKFPETLQGDSSFYLYFTCKYSADNFVFGDTVYNTVSIVNNYNDADSSNNSFRLQQFISSAYDPNLKESNPRGRVVAKPDRIMYTIHFQNEGNDTAIRVQVVDTLNAITPIYEVEVGSASHPFHFAVEDGIMVWDFNNIKLTPKTENEMGSSGFLTFSAKINKPFKVGDSLRNRAGIYFDYEKPVITNYASILMVKKPDNDIAEIPGNHMKNFSIFPNPSHDRQTIRNKSGHPEELRIYTSNGQLLHHLSFKPFEERSIDVSQWVPGIYVVVTASGESSRIIKIQ